MVDRAESWPALPLAEWRPSYETLHLWMQIVGKVRLACTPLVNHWWNTTLYLTPRGLTTSAIPYRDGSFEMRFDFIDHALVIETSWGSRKAIPLTPQATADFYATVLATLRTVGIDVKIWPVAVELPAPVRLDSDREHASYDREHVHRWWRVMLSVDAVMKEFRARFIGKSSPVHFFWGSFDHAVSRFSGRRAPPRPGADRMTAEGYSHEVISAGFWPGSGPITDAAFYAYAAPPPEGFDRAGVMPPAAYYEKTMGEYILMYDDVRKSKSPRTTLLDFMQSTYAAAADLAGWNRGELERNVDR